MFDFHEKRKIRNILYSKWVAGCILVLSLFLATTVYDRYTVAQDIKSKLEIRKTELAELEHRAQVLKSKVQYLEGERGIEEELRTRFDVVKEGEQVVILIDERRKINTSTQGATGTPSLDSTPQKKGFLDFLKFW